jgi:hypothetical protein
MSAADLQWRWDNAAPLRWLLVDEFTMGELDAAVAVCTDIEGLFFDSPTEARLLGCYPEPPLQHALDALDRGAGNPGGALRRRWVQASIYSVAADGSAVHVHSSLHASVTAVRPSSLGDGLLDVTFDAAVADPKPSGAFEIWELWRAGRPAESGLWAGYDTELRTQWTGAALAHHRPGTPDKPAGTAYYLDGRNVTDLPGFYCAIGEAINGPGGYFGWNRGALRDCVIGGWGAARPFRLIWHHAAVARTHLAAASAGEQAAPAITLDHILQWLTEDGAEVELR